MMAVLRLKHVARCNWYLITVLMYICCVLDGNIHIFTTTQRDGPYKKNVSSNLKSVVEEVSWNSELGSELGEVWRKAFHPYDFTHLFVTFKPWIWFANTPPAFGVKKNYGKLLCGGNICPPFFSLCALIMSSKKYE